MTLFPENRSRYFASKNFSRMTPLVSTKKYPGRAMPLNCPTASAFRTSYARMVLESGSASRGKLDLAPVGEVLQDFLAVIADRRHFESLLFESCFRVLQLDQLPFAVGSPVGGTKEEKNGAVWLPSA